MDNKDNQDEGPKIPAILIIIILAAIGLYYFFSHRPPTALKIDEHPNAPLHPSHLNENMGDNTRCPPLIVKKIV